MENCGDVCSKNETVICSEFPIVPVRHKKILDRLARCCVCGRLYCCIEHCLQHESEHPQSDWIRGDQCIGKTQEWIEASEFSLLPRVAKNLFPFFCVYCRIKVNDEKDLKTLVEHGAQCPIKKCHWMVSMTIYHEETKEKEIKENIGHNEVGGPLQSARIAAKKPREKSLLRVALRNSLNLSLRTPPPANHEESAQTIGPLTSTPENDCGASTRLAAYMRSPSTTERVSNPGKEQSTNERVGILSTDQRSRIRKMGTTHKVTFACDLKIGKYGCDGSENELDNTKNVESACESIENKMVLENEN